MEGRQIGGDDRGRNPTLGQQVFPLVGGPGAQVPGEAGLDVGTREGADGNAAQLA